MINLLNRFKTKCYLGELEADKLHITLCKKREALDDILMEDMIDELNRAFNPNKNVAAFYSQKAKINTELLINIPDYSCVKFTRNSAL